MFIDKLMDKNLKYSNYYKISKYINFESFNYSIIINIMSSYTTFNIFDLIILIFLINEIIYFPKK